MPCTEQSCPEHGPALRAAAKSRASVQVERQFAVAIYWTNQRFGGPEEGGWWVTEGDLEGIMTVVSDEFESYRLARDFNTDHRSEGREAHVYELGRRQLRPEVDEQLCHADWEVTDDDYVVRWDVPTYFPERRPHYC